jgi:thioredoxin 1
MQVISELSIEQFTQIQNSLKPNQVLIIKFSATWCGPCKKIKPTWDAYLTTCSKNNLIFAEIDIDECIDLYIALKNKKMVKGVPTILAFYGNVKREHWYIPDDSFSGGEIDGLNSFLKRCEGTNGS